MIASPDSSTSAKAKHLRITAPTYFQSLLASAFLSLISLLFIPLTLFVTVLALTYTHILSYAARVSPDSPSSPPMSSSLPKKTVLVTGARANKALTLVRAFKRDGHRVILAEEEEWGTLACARFSNAIDSYYYLPNPQMSDQGQAYIDAICQIVQGEDVDAWVPCSSVHATMQDAEAAKKIHEMGLKGSGGAVCDTFIQHPNIAGTLHWKHELHDLLVKMGYEVPDSKVVTTVAQALDFLHLPTTQQKGHEYILKCLTLDDLARDDFTLLPMASRDETREHLKNMPTPISKDTPFMLQRFLKGDEYCTHVAVRQGEIVAFCACKSNDLLMRYVDITTLGDEEKHRAKELEDWVKDFLGRWKEKMRAESEAAGTGEDGFEKELTGHFSFDFMREKREGKWYVLECNARAHTAVALLSDTPTLGESYLSVTTSSATTSIPLSRPPPNTPPRSWIAHALPLSIIVTFLRLPIIRQIPISVLAFVHPGIVKLASQDVKLNSDPRVSPFASDNPFRVFVRFMMGTFLPATYVSKVQKGLGEVDKNMKDRVPGNDNVGHDCGSISAAAAGGKKEKDPYWEPTDPVPFFVLAHVTWLWIFARLALRGRAWRKVNVSTERVFEC